MLGGGKREKYTQRYQHLMSNRGKLLDEERGQDDVVDGVLRDIKQLSAPYIATGNKELVTTIDLLNRELKDLRMKRVKGIPEPEISGQTMEWLEERVEQLWEEKVGVSRRRPEWTDLLAKTKAEHTRVSNMPQPVHSPPPAAAGGSDDLDLDLDL